MFLLDLTHTSHTAARSGIQRVARALHRHLGPQATAITHDPYLRRWRDLAGWEIARIAQSRGGRKRGARWPLPARWSGRFLRWLGRADRAALSGKYEALIEPEVFGAAVGRALPELWPRVRGPRIAVFHDAIPLRFPELTPGSIVTRFPAYLRELLSFDGIAANSADSRDALLGYWRWLGATQPPPVVALPLGVDTPSDTRPPTAPGVPPVILCVGTLEARKNHLALLAACEQLWATGQRFGLRVIGHVNAETGQAAVDQIAALRAAGRPVHFAGPGSDEDIADAYRDCIFTVYPSIAEGFGLPVIESLARGKPCVCSSRGALGEISRGGGCVALDSVDPASLAAAIGRLLQTPAELAALAEAAHGRTFRTWSDYTAELTAWIQSLPQR